MIYVFTVLLIFSYLFNSIKSNSKFKIVEDKCTKEKNSCEHGSCVNVDNEYGYFCDCDEGYIDVNCDKGTYQTPGRQGPIKNAEFTSNANKNKNFIIY